MEKKLFENIETTLDEGSRTIVSVITTDAIDRDGEVVLPSGLIKKNYSGNPVVLVNHDWLGLPIGKCLWVKSSGNTVIAKTYITDKTELGRDVFGLLQDGILSAISIGFNSLKNGRPTSAEIKSRPELKAAINIHREWELLEYSLVTIPCNPEALTLAVSKGYSPSTVKFLNGGVMPSIEEVAPVDLWSWDEKKNEPEITKVGNNEITKVVKPEIPDPKYSRNVSDVIKSLERFTKSISNEEILDRYRGRI